MRYWYDTEFHEDGHTVDLISIGIVAEDGREYYAVNHDADWDRVKKNEWLCENVVPHLPLTPGGRVATHDKHGTQFQHRHLPRCRQAEVGYPQRGPGVPDRNA